MATLVATPEPDNHPPRVLLELDWAGQTSVTITRLDPDGRTRPVRLAEPAELSGGLWVGYDYESWLNQEAVYTATAPGGATVSTGPVVLTASVAWLRHPGVPSLSTPVEPVGPLEERVRAVTQAVMQPLGRRYPIVVTDGRRKAIASAISLRTRTPAEASALVAIADDAAPLLIDVPAHLGLGITHEYIALGDLRERAFQPNYGPDPWRIWTAQYVVVGRPAGGLQAQRTYGDVLAAHASYQELLDTYDSYADLLTGVTS